MEERKCEADPTAQIEVPEFQRVSFEVETNVPTEHGLFRVRAYRDRSTGADHVAWIAPGRDGVEPGDGALVRVHSECLTGEAFGSQKCECGPQLDSALETIQAEGGVVIYLRGHERRGIGLINKLKAYRLQEDGYDTLDANLRLGLPGDARDYGAATAILKDLGISRVRLLSNNPEKARQLEERGVTVTELVPLVVGVGIFNEGYLDAKRDRMGHALPTHEALDEALQSAAEGNS
jgi:3,4-dihydroxy 2-butanone 4-phosphate synthase/GTP cyclohydrolase II